MVGLPTEIISHFVRTRGVRRGLIQWGKRAYLRKMKSHEGENIFESDWDVLVILDACRPDLLQEVSTEYPYLGELDTRHSVGTATMHWMEQTFSEAPESELQNTVYVCGNPFSGHLLDGNQFQHLEDVWKWGWSEESGTVLPRPITDAAISLARDEEPERLLVHYMQPHTPFVTSSESPKLTLENFDGSGSRPLDDWEMIEMCERSEEEVWEDYLENLRHVLDDVELLQENVDGDRMVVTSDHGNAVGERGLYGHPGGISIPALYEVPWCETDAKDSGSHQPSEYRPEEQSEDIESKLDALGYR